MEPVNVKEPSTDLSMDDIDFETVLDDYLNSDFGEIEEQTIVQGEVVRIDDNYVLIDVGFKSEGQVPLSEFLDSDGKVTVTVGDKVDVFVAMKNEGDGTIILSREKAQRMRVVDELERMMDSGDVISGRLIRRIKGGYNVDLNGLEAFLPGSHVDLRPVPDMDALVGQSFDFKVLKVNRRRSNVIISRRVLLEEERDSKRGELIKTQIGRAHV